MEILNLTIEGMSCGGCTASVSRAVSALAGVSSVEVTLQPGGASISYDPAAIAAETIITTIEEAGYDVIR
ncbi:heavy-metal-associated domain-containing protein [Chitinilyticum piscinae]|uniref:Heavy-metal-associated domain-containing protein n=1 Tax=Chitinilyticum piscinae TaxID=2866724 RepID=A0A8J7FIZ4_9NEIS|nr:cation transporter [Chitinilyticum piscinae]MBE9608687.1 heavy-metal-associated domain-containing protein [Chitinilyticum piscinae]